jgi:mono/diheme cytochrome c family protein
MARSVIMLLLIALFPLAALAEEGRAEAGLAYARSICAKCHSIRKDDAPSPNPNAPSFRTIANTPGITGAALFVILQTPHRLMPDLIVSARDKADVAAYILTLKNGE